MNFLNDRDRIRFVMVCVIAELSFALFGVALLLRDWTALTVFLITLLGSMLLIFLE